jgi:hypothetical protein
MEELVATPARPVERAKPVGQVAVQAAAVAVTSLAAGAGAVAVLRGRRARGGILRPRRRSLPPVLATRSFLIDVHVLDGSRR